jgi:hypothetical protein
VEGGQLPARMRKTVREKLIAPSRTRINDFAWLRVPAATSRAAQSRHPEWRQAHPGYPMKTASISA